MEHLISMYAALEKYPVMVSYPDGQMAVGDFNYAHGYNHDFITSYSFGPYKLEHNSVARDKQFLNGASEKLLFTKNETALYIQVLVTKHLMGLDKDYVALSKAIKAKANGKKFQNPFAKTISDSIYDIQFYLTELTQADDAKITYDEIQEMVTQLDTIKQKLLLTQNINYQGK